MAVIVHVGNFPSGLRPGFQHGVPRKITNGLIRNGHLVLEFADRDVARARSPFGHRTSGVGAANRALIEFCRHHRPEMLLLSHADVIRAATLRQLRDALPAMPIAQLNVDPLFEIDNLARLRSKLDAVDFTFVSTAGPALDDLRAGGKKAAFLPNPVDLSIERGRAHEQEDLPFDVFYACGDAARPLRHICGRDWNMNDFFARLLEPMPALRANLGGVRGAPRIVGDAYQRALEMSAIGLNISRRPDYFLYSSDRIAQFAGNGLLVAIERSTGYDTLFSDDEMAFFGSLEELAELLQRSARDRRQRMTHATTGRRRYIELFNERSVAAYIVAIMRGERDPNLMPWQAA